MIYQRVTEDRTLTYLTLLQVLAVFFGWALLALGVGLWTKAGVAGARPSAVFARDWGPLFFLVPVAWLAAAVLIKRRFHWRYNHHLIFWSGLGLAVLIVVKMAAIGASAGASMTPLLD